MKNIAAIAGPLLALGFWLLDAQPAQCFYNQGGCARASTPAPEGAAIGTPPVQHEYGPFGEAIRATGPMAKANPLRFSTKYQDDETDLLYYGYRYYNASTGRWLSRDPIGEKAGLNLHGFVANAPVQKVDALGRLCIDPCTDAIALGLDKGPDGKSAQGIVVCCEGRKYACVWPSRQYPYTGKALDIVRNCMLAHEEAHFNDVLDCPLCSFIVSQPRWKKPVDPHRAECRAYQQQLKCLQETKGQCGGDPDCEVQVHIATRMTEMSIEDKCAK